LRRLISPRDTTLAYPPFSTNGELLSALTEANYYPKPVPEQSKTCSNFCGIDF
jgi:hypothetical protein